MTLTPIGICCAYKQRSVKPTLPFCSFHLRSVKVGIIKSLISFGRAKSCFHRLAQSTQSQFECQSGAGYPVDMACSVMQQFVANRAHGSARVLPRGRKVGIPNIHSVRPLATRYGKKVAFRCSFKLQSMCKPVNGGSSPPVCVKKDMAQHMYGAPHKWFIQSPCSVARNTSAKRDGA